MTNTRRLLGLAAAGLFAWLAPGAASAQGNLTVYCSVQEEWCRPMMQAFERATGIRVAMTRRSSGETLTQIRAESSNPRGDVWWGGTGDPHMQAAQENLTVEYRSPMLDQVHDWARRQAEQTGFRTIGIYAGALGYSYNTNELTRRRLAAPRCWSDLTAPGFRGEVQVADPNTSGTAYTMLATLVQLMGEEPAFQYLRNLHRNVNQYTRSGAAPARAVATGETLVGITFLHDAVTQKLTGAPVEIVAPCEGTGYEIGSMSIIRGARNMEQARRFYDWALTAEAQGLAVQANAFQLPSNRNAPIPPQAPRFENIRLIDYDFARWGSAEERTRLLTRWEREVRAGSR
ncbi:ABC transporter substrate-binding protein [Falsiroseomonas oryzae]|uniref:ABC transporter substrate-binding protein n=1 Tax=Falsiroseomonas oryzae TaxID=2766473 RepID=UPI0022EA6EA1|nr:ABC transporter substrate-binding protein [Roseomonas sp. MO-31]